MEKKTLVVSGEEFGITEVKAKQIHDVFAPMLNTMVELEKEFNEIINLEKTLENCILAGTLRKKYVKKRTAVAALHKEQKAFYLAGGRFCDAIKNAHLFASQGIEEQLVAFEKHYEIQEQKRVQELHELRSAELAKFGVEVIPGNLGEFDEVTYSNFLLGAETAFNNEKKLEEERIAQEEAERVEAEAKAKKEAEEKAAEDKRIREENESLRIKADEEKKARELAEAESNKKLEAERKAREKAEAEAQAKLDEEKKAREVLEKQDADRVAKLNAEKEAQEKEAKNLAKAPDKKKLFVLGASLMSYEMPEMKTAEGKRILEGVKTLLGKVSVYVDEQTQKM